MVYILVVILFLLVIWFRKVWNITQERRHTVEIAIEQLNHFRAKSIEMQNNPERESILKQKEAFYRQSVRLYHIALENPFNWLPATLMGFRPIKEDGTS